MSKKLIFGSHVGLSDVEEDTGYFKYVRINGGRAVQFFASNPRAREMKVRDLSILYKIRNNLSTYNMVSVIHSPYLFNFAKPYTLKSWWIKRLIDEMHISYFIGSIGSILHMGKIGNLEDWHSVKTCDDIKKCREKAINTMVSSLQYVLTKTPSSVNLIFETSTGNFKVHKLDSENKVNFGSELGFHLDELAFIYNKFTVLERKRIKFCIDTCHTFAAGYDLSSKKGIKDYFLEFDKKIGIKNIVAIHLNDSKTKLGSRKDRHQNLGYGFIGLSGIKEIIKYAKKLGIPIILETPTTHYKDDIQLLKSS